MDPDQAAAEEKARIRRHLQQNSSQNRDPASGSNTVPMTEEEEDTLSQHSPVYSPPLVQQTSGPVPSAAASYPRQPTPPPYSGPTTSAQHPLPPLDSDPGNPKPPPRYPGLPALDYRLYKPPHFDLSADKTTTKTTSAHLSSSAEALAALIRQQATIPPKPQVHITGQRGGPGGGRIDFAIKLNLLPLLVPADPRQRMDYLRCVSAGELAYRGGTKPTTANPPPANTPSSTGGSKPSLDAWAARYIADTASVKSFTLERTVVNLDVDWLEGQIRTLVAALRYPGTVTVAFPITHARVVVQNPDRVNKFITSVTSFFAGKQRYEVVKAVWPFATVPKGSEISGGNGNGNGHGGGRRCAVQSEEVWWREWRGPIRHAIAAKRQGWVTNEDKLEALMEGSAGPASVNWEQDY
ncbi:uncharacterized protein C8A04DRAFT_10226 [Dichotomopilus funicola]|uniref:Uncharacterized protein n=1 Tax=Dichotomopilus funicola TaxID=1934379 RepID=A0AAN6ZQ32_9PEZI|nr:hypothetical protein C8A04DRAFT_10226 [Dichotomopilus funicola]